MDQLKTGQLIRFLRQRQGMTQLDVAKKLNISDKTVSKWERGCGTPDVALLPKLTALLLCDVETLLKGELRENMKSSGSLKKMKFYVCPQCGNILFATDPADIRCCMARLAPMEAQKATDGEKLSVEKSDTEWYITSPHPMTREHYIGFVALVTGDTVTVKKLYPEWGIEVRLPMCHGTLYYCCTKHGLYYQLI